NSPQESSDQVRNWGPTQVPFGTSRWTRRRAAPGKTPFQQPSRRSPKVDQAARRAMPRRCFDRNAPCNLSRLRTMSQRLRSQGSVRGQVEIPARLPENQNRRKATPIPMRRETPRGRRPSSAPSLPESCPYRIPVPAKQNSRTRRYSHNPPIQRRRPHSLGLLPQPAGNTVLLFQDLLHFSGSSGSDLSSKPRRPRDRQAGPLRAGPA